MKREGSKKRELHFLLFCSFWTDQNKKKAGLLQALATCVEVARSRLRVYLTVILRTEFLVDLCVIVFVETTTDLPTLRTVAETRTVLRFMPFHLLHVDERIISLRRGP